MNESLMGIGVVSQLIGRSSNTIRIWEKEGLIHPRRASTGVRIFSEDDIEELRRIALSMMENRRTRSRKKP